MTRSRGLRRRLTAAEVAVLWEARQRGQTLTEIAARLGVSLESIYGVVERRGGIAPRPRRRAPRALRLEEREEISRELAAGASLRAIARRLGRAPSTISREIRRHAPRPTRAATRATYRATVADRAAWQRARRPKPCRLVEHAHLRQVVARQLAADWSPEQIAAWLVTTYPDEPTMRVSHETIYRTLYVQARGALKKELVAHLRHRHSLRRPRGTTRRGQGHGQIVDAVSIAERPPAVEDRAVPGHWEGDLLAGAKASYIATLVERRSRYVQLVRVPNKETSTVVAALIREVQRLPRGLMASLTWDRGMELAHHHRFHVATDVAVYFCDPRSPWQRGSNENTNGLLRQYFPHGTDLRPFTQRQLDAIAKKLNTRPRQTLGWRTPASVLAESVAPTG
jgi:transposase, IS30 family